MHLTTDQYATLFNFTGVLVVLGLSLVPLRLLSTPFYRNWTLAYSCALIVIAIEFVSSLIGRSGAVPYVSVAVIALDALLVANTAQSLRATGFKPRQVLGAWALTSVVGFAGLAAGLSSMQVIILPALGLAFSFMWLGIEVFRTRQTSGKGGAKWLALPLIALGVWLLSYGMVSHSTAPWVGYWISGLLNLWVGVGMLVYLLLDMAETLKRSNAELRTLDALKNNVLNTISHEIRTPLTAIRAAASFLDHGTAQDRERFKAMVETNSIQLDRLLGDILDFAKMEAKVLSFELEPIDLGDIAVQARDIFTPIMSQHNLQFEAEIQELAIPVSADPDRLLQVFSNLLSNAAKFTSAGGTVTLWAGTAEGVARVVVRDTGIGIPEEAVSRVFEKFFQVDGGISRRYGGAGLGLPISKMIVEEGHGGKILVNSVEGKGSEFIVEIPLKKEAAAA